MSSPRGPVFAGVLGWPLRTTLSPDIHNAAFDALGIPVVYRALPVRPEHLARAVDGLRSLGALGANVTMPHKGSAATLVDDLSGDAGALGAINTIQVAGDRLIGHNTDVEGFAGFLRDDIGFDARDKTCVVLGAGGAARAVVRALAGAGAARVTVAARRRPEAEAVAGLADGTGDVADMGAGAVAAAAEASLIVNATPVGSDGKDPLPGCDLRRDHTVVDLIYSPPSTPLLDRARAAGADAWGGLGMLVLQAALSFRIWTGKDAPIDVMSAAAVRALGSTRPREVPKELEHGDES